ncbi:hypothetical protein CEP14_10330 [Cylindrospermopsis raciborskii C04]|uniref:Transposase n=2 Tax=Cylindrospermopsis raciborskii TaxID=77022 RepID=A0ABX4WME2_9CYAN|nr:hypothetical protein CEP13_13255 [Cylindrospermopsis raciborskii C03]PNJ94240.1 hypothetical protein CEP15_13505 [Cylindrospermopsis raciborskii C07]PNJ94644.1 hypothetical protein CEP14_10330 [Cylindrospermopsis raciborskii C04]
MGTGDREAFPTGDREALPTGHRSPRGTFHVRFAVGKRLTVNVFRQRINQLFQGVEDIWRGIAKHSRRAIALHSLRKIAFIHYPPVSSQGKNLNVLRGDCEALPTGDRAGLPTGHRSHLGTFHVRFAVGKRLTVNVFRQRMNQLFQGVEDIWRGIAKHSQWAIALSDYPPIPSQGKNLNILKGDRIALPLGDRSW